MRNAYSDQPSASNGTARGAKPYIALVHSSTLPDTAAGLLDVGLYIQSLAKELELIAASIGRKNLASTLMIAAAAAGAEAKDPCPGADSSKRSAHY
jgi:hypothetical protein